jgi:hypothetical protein
MKIKTAQESYVEFAGWAAMLFAVIIFSGAVLPILTLFHWWVYIPVAGMACLKLWEKGVKNVPLKNLGVVLFMDKRTDNAYSEGKIWILPGFYSLKNVSLQPKTISVPPPGGKEFKFLAIESAGSAAATGTTTTAEMTAEYTLVVEVDPGIAGKTFDVSPQEAEKVLITLINATFRELAATWSPEKLLKEPANFQTDLQAMLVARDFEKTAKDYGLKSPKLLIKKISPSGDILKDLENQKREELQARAEQTEADHTRKMALQFVADSGGTLDFEIAMQMAMAITGKSKHQTIAGLSGKTPVIVSTT